MERKLLAHFIDESFGGETLAYVRLGKDLEEYNEELNPDVDNKKNILGEVSFRHNGFQPQNEVTPYYPEPDSALSTKVMQIANERINGDGCHTTVVDVLLTETGTQLWAYREDVAVVPTSIGGGTDGVQAPFTIYRLGNRVAGTFNTSTNTFTPAAQSVQVPG
ncbi:MAG: hypothetical protein IKP95_12830 [Ruminococcus sp.]|nr:hypothetical protein [Ruminococcus sp.]MBR6103305.1 hypothetical protein [Ruminococcus sp.]